MAEATAFEVDDLIEVMGIADSDRMLSFIVRGDPPSQQRHKFAWKGILGGWMTRRQPIVFDPSSKLKMIYATKVRDAMGEIGLTYPYFLAHSAGDQAGLVLDITFLVERPPSHFSSPLQVELRKSAPQYPRQKDIDNMLKFTMDALQHVVYHNDISIRRIIAEKAYTQQGGGCTKLVFKPYA